jgi:hypothetical protein
MALARIDELRVGCDAEGSLTQAEVREIHG